MPIYHTLGQIPRKRHIAFKKPGGGIYAEELVGHEGFIGTSAESTTSQAASNWRITSSWPTQFTGNSSG